MSTPDFALKYTVTDKNRSLAVHRKSLRSGEEEVSNRLLAALPNADLDRIVPVLDRVPLTLKTTIHTAGEAVRHVYFPGDGYVSLLTVLEDGRMIEVAAVGREGVVGVTAGSTDAALPITALVQSEIKTCYRMAVGDFRREMSRGGAFEELLTKYAQSFVGMLMQTVACNTVHSVEQRFARWLLMVRDRVEQDEFLLTQEFAAMMLGTARPTVTIVAGILQKAGMIQYHRGRITIIDRESLESACCECYRVETRLLNWIPLLTTSS